MTEEPKKIDRIKNHLKENWKIYVVGAGGVIAGATGMAIFLTTKYGMTEDEMFEQSMTQIASIIKDAKINKSTINVTQQTISMYGNPIGRPGIEIVDTTTGKHYKSIKLAAEALELDRARIDQQLRGKRDHVNGHVFALPEAMAE